jgi:hypothetical protein
MALVVVPKLDEEDIRNLKTRFSNLRACLDVRDYVNKTDSQRRSASRTVTSKFLRWRANVVSPPSEFDVWTQHPIPASQARWKVVRYEIQPPLEIVAKSTAGSANLDRV